MNYFKIFTVSIVAIIVLYSCTSTTQEQASPLTDQDKQHASDFALGVSAYLDVFKIVEDLSLQNNFAKIAQPGTGLSCVNSDTINTGSGSVMTITFDPNCTNYDGKVRSGSLEATFSDRDYNNPGTVITIILQNYKVDGMKFNGKIKVTCINDSTYSFKVSDKNDASAKALITLSDNTTTFKWKLDFYRKGISNLNDNSIYNDIYEVKPVDGTTYGVGLSRTGGELTVTNTSVLTYKMNCPAIGYFRYPVSGKVKIASNIDSDLEVDFGQDCDRVITLVQSGYNTLSDLY